MHKLFSTKDTLCNLVVGEGVITVNSLHRSFFSGSEGGGGERDAYPHTPWDARGGCIVGGDAGRWWGPPWRVSCATREVGGLVGWASYTRFRIAGRTFERCGGRKHLRQDPLGVADPARVVWGEERGVVLGGGWRGRAIILRSDARGVRSPRFGETGDIRRRAL